MVELVKKNYNLVPKVAGKSAELTELMRQVRQLKLAVEVIWSNAGAQGSNQRSNLRSKRSKCQNCVMPAPNSLMGNIKIIFPIRLTCFAAFLFYHLLLFLHRIVFLTFS